MPGLQAVCLRLFIAKYSKALRESRDTGTMGANGGTLMNMEPKPWRFGMFRRLFVQKVKLRTSKQILVISDQFSHSFGVSAQNKLRCVISCVRGGFRVGLGGFKGLVGGEIGGGLVLGCFRERLWFRLI